jgi:heme exporter protein C
VRAERVLVWTVPAVLAAALILGLVVSPPDALQGQTVRLMYLHVPAAVLAYLAFAVAAAASAGYLIRRDLAWDRRARAAAELGVGFTALTLAEGSLWARPTWGVFWVWDPRLVATALLLLVFLGYLAARRLSAGPHVTARRAAVIALAGFVVVPVDHFSVEWWPSVHQTDDIRIEDPRMLAALAAAVTAFALLACWMYLRRLRVLTARAADVAIPPAALPVPGAAAEAAEPVTTTAGRR